MYQPLCWEVISRTFGSLSQVVASKRNHGSFSAIFLDLSVKGAGSKYDPAPRKLNRGGSDRITSISLLAFSVSRQARLQEPISQRCRLLKAWLVRPFLGDSKLCTATRFFFVDLAIRQIGQFGTRPVTAIGGMIGVDCKI